MTSERIIAALVVVALTVAALWFSTGGTTPTLEPSQVWVVKVTDGDTIRVRDVTGQELTVRVVGIDTPETKHPQKGVECYGPEASAFAQGQLAGRAVRLVYSTKGDDVDRYGRTLAYVEVGGRDYGLEALQRGVARVYPDEAHDRRTKYEAAERRAASNRTGLWGQPTTKECR